FVQRDDDRAKGRSYSNACRRDDPPSLYRSRNDRDSRACRQGHIIIGRKGVDEESKLECLLAIGLQPDPWRTLSPITKSHRDRIVGSEKTSRHADIESSAPGTDISLVLPSKLECRSIGCFRRGEPLAGGI